MLEEKDQEGESTLSVGKGLLALPLEILRTLIFHGALLR